MQKEGDVFVEECEVCGKKFLSLNENQAKFNFKVHLLSCENKSREQKP